MASYMEKETMCTEFEGAYNITEEIQKVIARSEIQSGLCIVYCCHTTAGLVVTSPKDKKVLRDFVEEMNKIVPARNDFHHQYDSPIDAAGHVKSALVGPSVTLIVEGGKALVGGGQGVVFAEFDGPRKRSYFVKVISD